MTTATCWQGCYQDTWQDSIVPEAFCHPAKFARGLIHRIYRHLMEQGYITAGTTVLDPFGGVALGALDAMTYGLGWLGVELEPKFVALGKKNLELWRQRYGFRQGTLVQGDSRRLREVLDGAQVGCCISSPPYVGSVHDGNGIDASKLTGNRPGPHTQAAAEGYGTSAGQLGALPPGVVVSSPPYEASLHTATNGIDRSKMTYSDGRVLTATSSGPLPPTAYSAAPDNLGNTAGDTFWSASAQIMQELALLLPAGAVCAWVVKSYVSKKAIVPFPDQWRALCEAHGFVLVEEIHASLVEDHGTQEGLFGDSTQVRTEKKSFFRRLAEKKGSPRIDHETVLIMRKDGAGGGMCCVSSPPFHESLSSGETASEMKARWGQSQLGGDWGQSYGPTPGNLGNLPVGVCCVSSPPFCHSDNRGDRASFDRLQAAVVRDGNGHGGKLGPSIGQDYGTTPGNLGNMPVGRP